MVLSSIFVLTLLFEDESMESSWAERTTLVYTHNECLACHSFIHSCIGSFFCSTSTT